MRRIAGRPSTMPFRLRDYLDKPLTRRNQGAAPMTPVTRRALLSTAAAGFVLSTETACTSKANSRVTFGIIGLGRRGNYVGTHMAKNPNAQLGGICDIY